MLHLHRSRGSAPRQQHQQPAPSLGAGGPPRGCRCSAAGRPSGSCASTSGSSGSSSGGGSSTRDATRRQLFSQSAVLLGGAAFAAALPAVLAPPARAQAPGPVIPSPAVQQAIDAALAKVVGKGKAPVALRLAFHDAGTFSKTAGDGGPNASIQYELDRPESFGLKRGWRMVLELEKQLVGTPAEGLVSRADLVALLGAAAVAVCGGPRIRVPIGRQDATGPDPEGRMPGEKQTASELKASFASKGFSVREMVTLSGAHTIGGKGFGAPDVFDNAYYSSLLKRPWLDPKDPMATMIGLPSDHVLPDDPECLPIIQEFASDQAAFFSAFSDAYVKMTTVGATWRA